LDAVLPGAVSGILKLQLPVLYLYRDTLLDLTISSIVPLLISSVTAATVAYFLMGDKVLLTFNVVEAFNISNIPWYFTWSNIRSDLSLFF
jgi:CIC family chloride channel protein